MMVNWVEIRSKFVGNGRMTRLFSTTQLETLSSMFGWSPIVWQCDYSLITPNQLLKGDYSLSCQLVISTGNLREISIKLLLLEKEVERKRIKLLVNFWSLNWFRTIFWSSGTTVCLALAVELASELNCSLKLPYKSICFFLGKHFFAIPLGNESCGKRFLRYGDCDLKFRT